MSRLLITSPDGKHGVYDLTKPSITLGRGAGNDLVLNHSRVSRFHAVIKVEPSGAVSISDRGSTNGVYLNGTRIASEAKLNSGDQVRIGDFLLAYESVDDKALRISRAEIPSTLDYRLRAHSGDVDLKFTCVLPAEHKATSAELAAQVKKLQRENYLLTVLYDAGKALHSKLSIDDITEEIISLAFRIEGVERGFILLFDDRGQVARQTEVRYRRATEEANNEQPEIILSRAVIERMRSELAPILITDLSADERFAGSESLKISGLRSAMCAPLLAQERLAGVLYVDNLQKAAAFTQDELNIFAVVASQAAAAIDNSLAHSQLARQAIERSALERFLAPEVVEMIAANPSGIRLGGVNMNVSILFADIRNFTSLAETMAPETIVEVLNEYFTRVSDLIFEHGGTLDKYLGDGVMALFGAPISKGNDAANAMRAALAIQNAVSEFNRDFAPQGWPELRVGIGVNTGIVTAGNIGSPKRIDYTVIGDAVNVASRLCSSAQAGEILISQSTADEIHSGFVLDALEPMQVRGKTRALSVFSVKAQNQVADPAR